MNAVLEFRYSDYANSPSRKDGMSMKLECDYRTSSCMFIDHMCRDAKLPGRVAVIAMAYFHSFYLRQSFARANRWEVALACLALASTAKSHKKIFKDFLRIAQKYWRNEMKPDLLKMTLKKEKELIGNQSHSSYEERRLNYWKCIVFKREMDVIVKLQGELRIVTPHSILNLNLVNKCIVNENGYPFPPIKSKRICSNEVNVFRVIRDCMQNIRRSYRSIIISFYPPPWIAALSLHLAVRQINANMGKFVIQLISNWLEMEIELDGIKIIFETNGKLDLQLIYFLEGHVLASMTNHEKMGLEKLIYQGKSTFN